MHVVSSNTKWYEQSSALLWLKTGSTTTDIRNSIN